MEPAELAGGEGLATPDPSSGAAVIRTTVAAVAFSIQNLGKGIT